MGKYYAIKDGFDKLGNKGVINEIVNDWETTKRYTSGVKNAKFKSFTNLAEAQAWLGLNEPEQELQEDNCIHAYVDGSYNDMTRNYSYGVVLVKNSVIVNLDSLRCVSNTNTHQVEGELTAAVKALHTAYNNKERNIIIYHDYLGIGAHIDGTWKAKNDLSKKYVEIVNKYKKAGMNIRFKKVDAHTGNIYNEIADSLCKDRLDIPQTTAIKSFLTNNTLTVATEQIKNIIISMSGANPTSIIVKGIESATRQSEVAITNTDTKQESKTEATLESQQVQSKLQSSLPTNQTVIDIVKILNTLPEQKQKEILTYLNLLVG